MRAAVYARNSKPPKGWRPSYPGEESLGSWKTQLEKLRARAAADGATLVWEGHDIATGSDPNRPKWSEVFAAVRGGTVRRVYATKPDRIMRSAKHFLEIAEVFEERGAELVFTDSPAASVIRGDPHSKAFRGIAAIFAELELDLTRERSAAVMEIRDDGRIYGPRSQQPAGRPVEYGPDHKFRLREGRREHDRARCPACRVGKQGAQTHGGSNPENHPVGNPVGFPASDSQTEAQARGLAPAAGGTDAPATPGASDAAPAPAGGDGT